LRVGVVDLAVVAEIAPADPMRPREFLTGEKLAASEFSPVRKLAKERFVCQKYANINKIANTSS
jgi:hypothetical protein